MFQALRVPDFRLLWGGGLISSLGSWLLVLAVPAHILAATGSLRDTGLTLAAQYLPQLVLGPAAGAFADGWDRRRLMIGANTFCAGAVAVMLLGTSPGRYWVLYAALVAESSGTVLYAPALQARMPAIVGTGPLLSSANSLTSASGGIVRLIGGPLGGVLLAVCGIKWLICADAVSYLLAAVAMSMTSRSGGGHPHRTAAVRAVARDLIEGTRVLRAQPAARALLPVTVIFVTANASLSAVLIPFGVQRLGGSEHTGLLLSCLGAGFLLGAPLIRALLDRAQPRNLLTASLTATAGAYFLLFTSSSLATALPAAAAVAMSGSMSLVIQQTTLQRVIPGSLLGRVSAVFLTGQAAATLIGSVAGPFLAQAARLVAAAAAASLLTLAAAALAFLTVPRVTRGGPSRTIECGPGRCLASSWRTVVTIVRIVLADPRTGRVPEGSAVNGRQLVVLADDSGQRAVPLWLPVIDAKLLSGLLERPAGDGVLADFLEETAARLLDAAGVTVTAVDIEPASEDVPELRPGTAAARVGLATAAWTGQATVSAGYGLKLAVAAGAPVRVADAVMDRLAVPVQGEDVLAPFLLPAAGRPAGSGRARRFEPRNMAFTDGLDRWDLAGSFLDAGRPHWQDYSCATADRSAVLASAVPEPSGSAVLVQTIYAEDYHGAAVTFRGQLRTTGVAGQAGLHLAAGRAVDPPGAQLRDRGGSSLSGGGSGGWTWHEVTLSVPEQAGVIWFGIFLAGRGRVELRDPELSPARPETAE